MIPSGRLNGYSVNTLRDVLVSSADADSTDGGRAVGEEAQDPGANLAWESHFPKGVDKAGVVHVIEETLDIQGEEGRDETGRAGRLDVVCEGKAGVKA